MRSLFLLTIIILVVVIILVFLVIKKKKIESYPISKNLKVAILIISAKSPRWNLEKEVWKQYANKFPNIDCFFIECDIIENLRTLTLGCKETYIPGIYQKSLQAIKKIGNGYDFYIRGNLSTFYIFEYLITYLIYIPRNIPVYTGGKIWKNTFVSGTSIILNKLAREKLIQFGFQKRYYDNKDIPDDVLISKIFMDHHIQIFEDLHKGHLYFWNYQKPYIFNLNQVKKHKHPFLRLKTNNLKDYKSIISKLLTEFYST